MSEVRQDLDPKTVMLWNISAVIAHYLRQEGREHLTQEESAAIGWEAIRAIAPGAGDGRF